MNAFKSLSQSYYYLLLLKIVLLTLSVISVGAVLVSIAVSIMYVNAAEIGSMVLVGWVVWLAYCLLFVIVFYTKKTEFKNKTELLLALVNKAGFTGSWLVLKNVIHKLRRK